MPVKLNAKTLALLGLGAGGGALFGKHVTPRIFGYEGDPAATNLSTLIDASVGAGLGALIGNPSAMKALLRRPTAIPAGVSAVALSEVLPMATHALGRGTEAANTLSRTRLLDQLREVAQTPEARGAGIGAAGAGLAGLASGLLRPQTEAERSMDASRGRMVASDFLKFVIPAIIAGGLGGKLLGGSDESR